MEQKLTRQSPHVICDKFVNSVKEGSFKKNRTTFSLYLKNDFDEVLIFGGHCKEIKMLLLFNPYAASYLLT